MSDTLKKPNSIPSAIAAIRTLEHLGHTYTEGAELWKPPLGKSPVFCTNANGPFDGDTEETRAAFREYDDQRCAGRRTTWQVWRDACAYMAGRTVTYGGLPNSPPRAVWRWGGDGQDHLESMGNLMVIEITAAQLRAALGWKDNLPASDTTPARDAEPAGWPDNPLEVGEYL